MLPIPHLQIKSLRASLGKAKSKAIKPHKTALEAIWGDGVGRGRKPKGLKPQGRHNALKR